METIFNEYYNLRSLGKGGFARVFKARHIDLGYVRAVKVSKDIVTGENDKAWQTFLHECKLLLKIGNGGHPNIVRIYQPRRIGNNAIVEMDYVEGETLHEYIRLSNHFVPMEEVWQFIHDIIGAMAYCHVDMYKFLMDPVEDKLLPDPSDGRKYIFTTEKEKELISKYCVVHNDLHSGNVMRRDYDGAYILLDFGLAKQNGHFVKSSSRNDGAREYCPPEKFDGHALTAASDVYSLGILLYEIMTGDVPFRAPATGSPESKASAIEEAHKRSTPPPILPYRKAAFEQAFPGQSYTRDFPELLEQIILKCLAKNPSDRFCNAKELKKELKKLYESVDELEILKADKERISILLDAAQSRIKELEINKTKTENELNDIEHELIKAQSELSTSRENNIATSKLVDKWKKMTWIIPTFVIGLSTIVFTLYNSKACDVNVSNINRADTIVYSQCENQTVERIIRDTISVRDTVKIEIPTTVTQTQTKVEYRTSPEVQQELNRLRNENRNLQGQVKRYEEILPK